MPNLQHLPIAKRPRERLLSHGVETLELEDLVAIILGTGGGGKDVLSLSALVSKRLLSGERGVLELSSIPGVGQAKASGLLAALSLFPVLESRKREASLADPSEVFRACSDLINLPAEHLVAFYLNARGHQLLREVISVGTATASLVHPREVFRPAILNNATHIILAHNHPSGSLQASPADQAATRQVSLAGGQVGITLLDHVICSSEGYCSLRETQPELFLGLLGNLSNSC